ncbi:MAG: hypothetical protein ACRDJ9_36210, partial [Dehalococcoidia bacterium]
MAALVSGSPSSLEGAAAPEAKLGLQFDLTSISQQPGTTQALRVALRPVVPGQSGWVRSGVAWSSLSYLRFGRGTAAERHRRLLNEIQLLAAAGEDRHYYGYQQQTMYLDAFTSRRIWDLLAEAQDVGLPLMQTGKMAAPVIVSPQPARVCMQADRVEDDLVLNPALQVNGFAIASECALLVGEPAHGVVWWTSADGAAMPAPKDRALRLAPLAAPLATGIRGALAGPSIRIPAHDEQRFYRDFLPDLLHQVE